jgi:hypothetical protein
VPSIIQDLGIVEEVLGDIASFAAGQPVNASIDGYNVTVVVLPNGPESPYVTIGGSILSIIGAVLLEYEAFSTGAPISLAVKENKTWYGLNLTKPGTAPVVPA